MPSLLRSIVGVLALVCVAGVSTRAGAQRTAQKDNAKYDDTFRKYSKRYFGIAFDWRRFKAQAMAESDLIPTAQSRVGARGLMQLMPSTFKEIATRRPEFASIDDPEWNIAAGILHDRHLWKQWSASVAEPNRFAFMFGSYNAGQGTITRAAERARAEKLDHTAWESIELIAATVPRWRYRETLGYVRRIEGNYGKLTARGRP